MDYENTKSFTKPEQVTLPPQRRPNTGYRHTSKWSSATGTLTSLATRHASSKPVTESTPPRIKPGWAATRSRPVVKETRHPWVSPPSDTTPKRVAKEG
jgi:hypothetical protein